MAIDANRVKYNNNFSSFMSLLRAFCKKLMGLGLCIGALQLLYVPPSHRISIATLEISGKIITMGVSFYDNLLKPVHSALDHISLLEDLKTENIELKLKLEQYKSLESTSHLLESENTELRKMLNVIPDAKYKRKTARLLSISLNPFSKTILIGAGANEGVSINQIIASDNALIGRIIEVSANYSKVMLINDFNSRIPVITSISHERGILIGDNKTIKLDYVYNQDAIEVSETILTSGDGQMYPYGIPVAEVISTEGDKLLLKPIMDLNNTNFVHIYSLHK